MSERLVALDAARGFAVVAMFAIHFVPTEGGAGLAALATGFTAFVYDKCASLFCVLVGVALALAGASTGIVWRRAAVLGAFGVVFGRVLWPTEILSPIALMMVATHHLRRLGRGAVWGALGALLVAVPIATRAFADFVWSDWTEDGRHLAESAFGLVTLRYYLFDGNYPLLPWLVFPLAGVLLVGARRDGRERAWGTAAVWCILAAVTHGYRVWTDRDAERLGDHADLLAVTWVPTSLPYVALGVTSAFAVIQLLVALRSSGGVDTALRPLAAIGRASLSHYVLHIALVFAPLRAVWPDEDWSAATGAWAFAGYTVFALGASTWWFRRARRGPLEWLWDRAARAG